MSVQTLYTAATGMEAMETKLDVIANNLANINTTGFKKDRANFEDLLYRAEVYPGVQDASQTPTAVGTQVGLGVRVTSTQTDQRQGTLAQTGRELDVAIQGRGYLRVLDPSSRDTMFTRAGNLDVNANGQLVIGSAQTGRLFDPPITIPDDATAIVINPNGEVMTRVPGQIELEVQGQIQLAQFINPDGLLKMGENMYQATDASGQEQQGNPNEQGLGQLRQGNLEASNVEPVQELIDLITTQRAFELNSQAVQAGDQIMQNISNLHGSKRTVAIDDERVAKKVGSSEGMNSVSEDKANLGFAVMAEIVADRSRHVSGGRSRTVVTKMSRGSLQRCKLLPRVVVLLLCSTIARSLSLRVTLKLASRTGSNCRARKAQTRWAFRTLSPVTVGSPIIRLGDVVQPLDPHMSGWQRLRRSPIGLVPLGGQAMTIERDRLARVIRDAEATHAAIDWVGPTKLKVIFRAEDAAATDRSQAIQQVTHKESVDTTGATEKKPILSSAETDRVLHWIELAIEREHPDIIESYRIDIDRRQSALPLLRSISGVSEIELRDPVAEGDCRFRVFGRSVAGPVESILSVKLTPHPLVVVPRRSLPRGHRIRSEDLMLKPIPEAEVDPDFLLDPKAAVGLEVHGTVRADRPLTRSELGEPILIRRGDLIEVRVAAGGITVTTNAKALGEGSQSELIEIETLQPRKRLVARVVQPGLVEIVTRAPKVGS